MITVFGSLNVDYVFKMDRLPQPGRTLLASDLTVLPGGKGGNQALAAAKAGATVRMVGAVGKDGLGDIALAGLRANGVDTSHVTQLEQPTGTAAINVDAAGENSIVVFSGANGGASHLQLDSCGFDDTSILLLQFEIPSAEIERAISLAKQSGTRIIWNLAPMQPVTLAVLRDVDCLVVNEGELDELCEELGLVSADEKRLNHNNRIKAVANLTGQSIVVTLAAAGCLAFHQSRLIKIPALPITPIDTVGAGDAFAGAFAAALDQNQTFEDALNWGNVAGALACLQPGAQSSLPTHAQILQRLPDLAS
jgi:ribokinase